MTITITTYNGEQEVRHVITNDIPVNLKLANEIADDLYGGQKKKVKVK